MSPSARRRRSRRRRRCWRASAATGGPMSRCWAAGTQNFFTDGGRELFDCAGQGRIDVFFLSGAQIDGEAQHQPGQHRRLRASEGALPRLVRLGLSLLCGAEGHPVPPRAHAPHAGGEGRFHQRAGQRARTMSIVPAARSRLITNRCLFAFDRAPTALRARQRASRAHRRRGDREHRLRLRPWPSDVPVDARPPPARICASCGRWWRRSWSRSIPSSRPRCSGCDKPPDGVLGHILGVIVRARDDPGVNNEEAG